MGFDVLTTDRTWFPCTILPLVQEHGMGTAQEEAVGEISQCRRKQRSTE